MPLPGNIQQLDTYLILTLQSTGQRAAILGFQDSPTIIGLQRTIRIDDLNQDFLRRS
ncbi:MAG: hypothetical protein M2R45_03143 [Verrucomicrobia subdivision 3 bacterium]|nr:hypothetical protein [Limisphaerales bacterium]MCS1413211.1 hypothetical protein [Limisphaerales bacterium]